MGEKLYRPIIKNGDHLVRSKENAERVRGISQDEKNKTTDIIEWEEVEIADDSYSNQYSKINKEKHTSEQEEFTQIIGEVLAIGVIYGASKLNEKFFQPWWENGGKLWIKEKYSNTKKMFLRNIKLKQLNKIDKQPRPSSLISELENNSQVDEMFNQAFDPLSFEMSPEEAKQHVLNLIYHQLAMAQEIKILSKTKIMNTVVDEKIQLENQKKLEKFLVEKVSNQLDKLLSDKDLLLDENTSKQVVNLLGGGIRINGAYIPVEMEKLSLAMNNFKEKKEHY